MLSFQGKTVFMPGLLATAHRGILYVDDINLLDTELCQILLGIVTDGWVNVEVWLESKRSTVGDLVLIVLHPLLLLRQVSNVYVTMLVWA